MTPRAKAPHTTQAERPTKRGLAPRALMEAHLTPRPIPKSPSDRKILESSFPTVIVPEERGKALTTSAQITKAITKVGVALRSDF